MALHNRSLLGIGLAATLLVLASAATAWWWSGDDEATLAELGEPRALEWPDLVPPDFVPAQDPTLEMSEDELNALFDGSDASNARLAEIDEALRYAPVDPALDGEYVTLPGYVVPLEFDGQTRVEEFLLVPYFGACIHTPPPPANQIVMAKLERATDVGDTYEPVLLHGILRTEESRTALAETGYTMEVVKLGALPD